MGDYLYGIGENGITVTNLSQMTEVAKFNIYTCLEAMAGVVEPSAAFRGCADGVPEPSQPTFPQLPDPWQEPLEEEREDVPDDDPLSQPSEEPVDEPPISPPEERPAEPPEQPSVETPLPEPLLLEPLEGDGIAADGYPLPNRDSIQSLVVESDESERISPTPECITPPPDWMLSNGDSALDESQFGEEQGMLTSSAGIVLLIVILLELNVLIWNGIISKWRKRQTVLVSMSLLR
jgi:hypothetical protein